MARFRNVKLSVIRQYENIKNYLKKKYRTEISKCYFSNFTLNLSNEGKVNSVQSVMTYSKELQLKINTLDKHVLNNI